MSAPKTIQDLVKRFTIHKASYKASAYNETQVRREFIDPFFKALGWDIDNKQGYAEAYKDVVHEDAIKVAGSTKAPDYAFRVGGTRKFFLEAKKPFVNIKNDPSSAYQLRRYGWSAKLPLSILTDFEELAVYDCRIKPAETDKASMARIAYYTYSDYDEKWDEISGTFSREAIHRGSFDKYADDSKRKRGTTEVDDAFLQEIEGWREILARNIALRNSGLSVRELNIAVQRTIDRIIFLRIAEDRGIETYGQLQSLKTGKDVYPRLTSLFRKADERYNSGLFHFSENDGSTETLDSFTLGLSIDDTVLKSILKDLYYPESPYEFAYLPADILGQVYEQFLGKVIRLVGKRAVVEEKPEIKKSGGIYYTPTFVVRHIVKQTVGEYLKDRTPSQVSGEDKRVRNAVPLRILDPACGSGSFLIEVYQKLLDWYLDRYVADVPENYAKGKEPRLYQAGKSTWRLTIAERRRILLTHIYGVDIDAQAVEVTKLSLLLKVLEGETADAIARQMDIFQVRALPDLVANIRCGNSLIGPDFYRSYQIGLFDAEEQIKVNAFDWKRQFPFLVKAGGFHFVIGNPPYLYSAGQDFIEYFHEKFEFSQYQTDYFVYFVEMALKLLRGAGSMSFIIPDSWLNSENFSKMRQELLRKWCLEAIYTFDFKVFRNANIENTILIASNKPPKSELPILTFGSSTESHEHNLVRIEDALRLNIIDPFYNADAEEIVVAMDKWEKLGATFDLNRGLHAYRTDGYGQSAFGLGSQTKQDQEERSYHSQTMKDSSYLPEIRGRDVSWLSHKTSGEFIAYGKWLAEPREAKFMTNPKLVCRKTLGNVLSLALIEKPAAIDQSPYIILHPDNNLEQLRFVLGLLASSLGAWYLRTKYSIYDKLHPWYTKKHLQDFPLPTFDDRIVDIVSRLCVIGDDMHGARIEADRNQLENEKAILVDELDERVFATFRLSEAQGAYVRRAVGREPLVCRQHRKRSGRGVTPSEKNRVLGVSDPK